MGLWLSTAWCWEHWGQKEGVYKAQLTWPRVVSFSLVSHWRWHMQKEEGLPQGYPLRGTEG